MRAEVRSAIRGMALNAVAGAAFVGLLQLPSDPYWLKLVAFFAFGLVWALSISVGVVAIADGASTLRKLAHLATIVPALGNIVALLAHALDLARSTRDEGLQTHAPPAALRVSAPTTPGPNSAAGGA